MCSIAITTRSVSEGTGCAKSLAYASGWETTSFRDAVDSRLGETRLRLMVQDEFFRVDQDPKNVADAIERVLSDGEGIFGLLKFKRSWLA